MSERVDIEKEVEDSLKVFEEIIDYKHPYVFPEESFETDTINEMYYTELKLILPKFSETNFSKFVKWFSDLERYAKWKPLTKESICMLISKELSPFRKVFIKTTIKLDKITTLLQLEIILVKELFDPKIVNKTIVRVVTDPFTQKDINEIIIEFIQRCRELVIASLSFQEPNVCVNKLLILRLLNLLPEKLRNKSQENIKDINSISIKEVIDIIIREKENLNTKMTKPDNAITMSKRKEESDTDNDKNDLKGRCFCCGEKGHLKASCVYKKETCELCNKIGHLSKACNYQVTKNRKNQSKKGSENIKKGINAKGNKEDYDLRKLQEVLEDIEKRITQLEIE